MTARKRPAPRVKAPPSSNGSKPTSEQPEGGLTREQVAAAAAQPERKPRLVHLGTTIQSTWGLVDSEGNAPPLQPFVAQIGRFAPDALAGAHAMILGQIAEVGAEPLTPADLAALTGAPDTPSG